jgi:hypothetical protein
VSGFVGLAVFQADPALVESVQRIAWAQIVMAALMGLAWLAVIVAALYAIRLIRSARASIQPIIDRANRIAGDATEVSESVRGQVDELLGTVSQTNERLREAVRAAELRVREFGAVLEAVQGETEEVLLDTAAAARGVHVAAESLRQPRNIGRARGPAVPPPPPPAAELDAPVARKELGG